jgi:hypothetical protein
MGNANTALSNWEMVEWLLTEIDKMRELSANNSVRDFPSTPAA